MHPILIDLGPIRLYTYGFFLALGFLTAIWLSGREARRVGLPIARFYDLCLYIIVAALVGSRLLYVLLELDTFLKKPWEIVYLWKGGLVFQGGLVLALAVAFYYMRRHQMPWRTTFDALAVGMPVGQAIGRVGCFMAGCCYGAESDLPWAVTFTHPETLCPLRVPLHPSQLYESLLLLPVFGVIYSLRTRKSYEGQLALVYFCLAGTVRFLTEFVRHPLDYRGPVLFGVFPATQVFALAVVVISGALLLYYRRPRKKAD